MSQQNVDLVRSIYAALGSGDVETVLAGLSPDVEWREADNFPYADGNPYRGPDAVVSGVFARLGGEWDGFSAAPDELLDAGQTVVALGRYGGTYKETGRPIDAQFVHVWRIADGRVVAFQQYTDTLQAAQVTGSV